MKNQSKFLFLAATVLTLSIPAGAMANHKMTDSDGYQVVVSGNGNAVHDSHGNCVRTKWKSVQQGCECKEAKPEQVAVRSYQIYFAFNKAHLSSQDIKIIKDAANTAKSEGAKVHFSLVGHADSVGSSAYNLKLSERRAHVVKHALVHAGIKEHEITVKAVGKSHLLVETGDNVKEAKNRVVEITVHPLHEEIAGDADKY